MKNHPPPLGIWDAFALWEQRGRPILPNLDFIRSRNRDALCRVVTLIDLMCYGVAGTQFFLGTDSLGQCFGVHAMQAHRWLKQLEQLGVITRTWTGGLCKVDRRGERYKRGLRLVRDAGGKPYPAGAMAPRASEYVYNGTNVSQKHV